MASLSLTGRTVVLGHTLNKHTLMKTDEQKKVLSKFAILCRATFMAILGCTRPEGHGVDTRPAPEAVPPSTCPLPLPSNCYSGPEAQVPPTLSPGPAPPSLPEPLPTLSCGLIPCLDVLTALALGPGIAHHGSAAEVICAAAHCTPDTHPQSRNRHGSAWLSLSGSHHTQAHSPQPPPVFPNREPLVTNNGSRSPSVRVGWVPGTAPLALHLISPFS